MRLLRRPVVLAGLGLALAAGSALAQEPEPAGIPPSFDATYTVADGRATFTITLLNFPDNRNAVYDFEFTGEWVPPHDTPPERFEASGGFGWTPGPSSGTWRVVSSMAMQTGIEYRFTLPVNPPPTGVVTLRASDVNHFPHAKFDATPPPRQTAAGVVPRHFSLGPAAVAASGFFSSERVQCGLAREFEDTFEASTRRGVLTIRRPRTGDTVSGRVAANGVFRLQGPTETYRGVIVGSSLGASYTHTRDGCPATYVARLELERAGSFVPACARPTIVAPARARVVRGSRVSLRIGVTCAGSALTRWPMQVTLRDRGRTFRVGSFRTTLARRAVTVRLGDTRPSQLVIRAGAGSGLAAATKRVRLVYG